MRVLAEVRTALRTFQQGAAASIPAADLAQRLDSVQKESMQLGLDEISGLTKDTIGTIFNVAADGEPAKALASLSRLETLLLRKSLEDDYLHLDLTATANDDPPAISVDKAEFEFSVNHTGDRSPAQTFEQPEPALEGAFDVGEAELEGFEIDDELLEIFAGEAEELLQNIENSLAALAANPNDKDSLWEIRRNAHTFKGSAGIVGLKQISELAHRVEDLLDRLAEASAESNPGILSFLSSSFDCLKALTAGENSPALFHRISQLYYDFDGILAGFEIREDPAAAELPPTFTAAEESPSQAAEVPAIVDEALFLVSNEEKQPHKQAAPRSVVRVSLERLDELVAIVRDMIIGRSAFEQRLRDLERQIEELHNTTRRLQSTSTKLEVDFEASMLSSDRSSIFGAVISGNLNASSQQEFDELEFDNYTDFHQSTREIAEVTNDTFAINTALDVLRGGFETLFAGQRGLIDDLQEKLLRIRMVDFGSLTTRLQRAVRVTCEEEKKKAEVLIENEAAHIDTQILDTLVEPLMHLLKNAVVHGIETPAARNSAGKPESGTIRVNVTNEETHIVVTVSDDGRGLDPKAIVEKAISLGLMERKETLTLSDEAAIGMIFLPGLSTAEKLNISAGRGVGMSIVKESIEANNGTISLRSEPGSGTTFAIRMPLPLAVTNVLVVESGKQAYAMPLKQARQVIEFEGSSELSESVEISGEELPLLSMAERLGQRRTSQPGPRYAVLVRSKEREFALQVDGVRGTEEVVIKSLGSPLDRIDGVIGAAMLGSGELVPIVDALTFTEKVEQKANRTPPAAEPDVVAIMIVDDSPSVRHLTSKVVTGAGWKPMTAKDGLDALEQLKSATSLPAVILSDIEMPRMDGYEFAASLQRSEEFAHIPVIMITSRSAEKHRDKALESGVSQYLTKPYEDRVLVDTIRDLANIT